MSPGLIPIGVQVLRWAITPIWGFGWIWINRHRAGYCSCVDMPFDMGMNIGSCVGADHFASLMMGRACEFVRVVVRMMGVIMVVHMAGGRVMGCVTATIGLYTTGPLSHIDGGIVMVSSMLSVLMREALPQSW